MLNNTTHKLSAVCYEPRWKIVDVPSAQSSSILSCEGGSPLSLPSGAYTSSCKNIYYKVLSLLTADCFSSHKEWTNITSINPQTCGNKSIGNNNGQLVCE